MLLEYNKMAPLLDDPVEHPRAVQAMRESMKRRNDSVFMQALEKDIQQEQPMSIKHKRNQS